MEWDRIGGSIASAFLSNAAQFIAGGVLAVALFAALRGRLPESWRRSGILVISLYALFGAALPLGIYGVLPIAAALASAGLSFPSCAAFLFSNRLFNMLVPSADPGFIWKTGFGRPILAVAAAAVAGAFLFFFNRGDGLFRAGPRAEEGRRPGLKEGIRLVGSLSWKAAVFLAAGAVLDVFFRRYLLREAVGFIFSNRVTGPLAVSFAQLNVVSPLFLLGGWCLTVMADFIGLSGLAVIVKPKGVAFYLAYCAALAAALCSIALFL